MLILFFLEIAEGTLWFVGGTGDSFWEDLVDVFHGEGAVQVAGGLQGQLGLGLLRVP